MKDLQYSVREFQSRLGEALRAAREGGRVRIVSHGQPDVLLSSAPAATLRLTPVQRSLQRLAALGRIVFDGGGPIPRFKVFAGSGFVRQVLVDRR